MLLRLFIATLWPPAGKRLTSWLLFVVFNCVLPLSHVVSSVADPGGALGASAPPAESIVEKS